MSTSDTNGTSLSDRLCAVMGAIGTVEKSGFNSFHNYYYATDADVMKAVRPLFAKHGIALIPSVAEVHQDTVERGDGKTALHTRVRVRYTLIAGAETLGAEWWGEAEDTGDKGTYKAYTGAGKTWLAKLLLIDTGDDPEADTRTDEHASRGAGQRTPHRSGAAMDAARIPEDPLDWRFPFGKMKGRALRDVLADDAGYCEWAWASMDKMPEPVRAALGAELGKVEIPAGAVPVPDDTDDGLPF